jgi:GDP-L-fucose synthase
MSPKVIFPLKEIRVGVAGHKCLIGSAFSRRFERENCEILTVDRKTVDLSDKG